MRKLFSLVSVVTLLASPVALAKTASSAKTESCHTVATALEKGATPPAKIRQTNNLRRAPGSITVASGKPVVIYGTLQDEHCVPISDARVEVWQAGGKGASGTSITDNMGHFTFLAALPFDFSSGKLWHIRIKRPDAASFQTVLYLADGSKNYPGPTAQPDQLKQENAQFGAPYNVEITLKAGKQYRRY